MKAEMPGAKHIYGRSPSPFLVAVVLVTVFGFWCMFSNLSSAEEAGKPPNSILEDTQKRSLQTERLLHPADAFTGYVLDQGELWIGWSVLPPDIAPGWMLLGITDWLTIETDLLNWLGGVANINLKFALLRPTGGSFAIAYETMALYLPEEIEVMESHDHLSIVVSGLDWFHHISLSWKLSDTFHLHGSLGVSFTSSLAIRNDNRSASHGKETNSLIDPAASIGLSWCPLTWMSLHTAASYGSTFTYLDNVPRKSQVSLVIRLAPLAWLDVAFLNNLRFETALLSMYFHDAQETLRGIVAYAYWSWDLY